MCLQPIIRIKRKSPNGIAARSRVQKQYLPLATQLYREQLMYKRTLANHQIGLHRRQAIRYLGVIIKNVVVGSPKIIDASVRRYHTLDTRRIDFLYRLPPKIRQNMHIMQAWRKGMVLHQPMYFMPIFR